MALVLIRGENNSKILNAIADVERHANLNLTTKPKKIDAKYADKIVENILKAPLRTKSKVATAFRIKEDTATAIVQIKKIHPPAHIVVISNDYDDYKELNKSYKTKPINKNKKQNIIYWIIGGLIAMSHGLKKRSDIKGIAADFFNMSNPWK